MSEPEQDPTVRSRESSACLYVIEIDKGKRIKVGYSIRPVQRLAEHRSMAEAHGCTPGREWHSQPDLGMPGREVALLNHCEFELGGARVRGEYFSGVAFRDAARYAAELCRDGAALRKLGDRRTPRRWAAAASAVRLTELQNAAVVDTGLPLLLLTMEEVGQVLGISPGHIKQMAATGKLPTKTIGRAQRFRVTDVEALLSESAK